MLKIISYSRSFLLHSLFKLLEHIFVKAHNFVLVLAILVSTRILTCSLDVILSHHFCFKLVLGPRWQCKCGHICFLGVDSTVILHFPVSWWLSPVVESSLDSAKLESLLLLLLIIFIFLFYFDWWKYSLSLLLVRINLLLFLNHSLSVIWIWGARWERINSLLLLPARLRLRFGSRPWCWESTPNRVDSIFKPYLLLSSIRWQRQRMPSWSALRWVRLLQSASQRALALTVAFLPFIFVTLRGRASSRVVIYVNMVVLIPIVQIVIEHSNIDPVAILLLTSMWWKSDHFLFLKLSLLFVYVRQLIFQRIEILRQSVDYRGKLALDLLLFVSLSRVTFWGFPRTFRILFF